MGGVKGTRYLLKIRNHAPRATHHAPRKAKNSVPPLFFKKAGDKYISCGSHGFREEDFLSFSHYKSMGAYDPWVVTNLDPRGMADRIYVGDH